MKIEAKPAHLWLGRQPYEPLWFRMRQQAASIAEGADEVIWTCEHEAVYTTGRRGVDNRIGKTLPAPLLVTDRGGETTFHGPGQVMLYPHLHLRMRDLDVKAYVSVLEQSCIDLLAGFDVQAQRKCGFPGVWLDDGKVAALGVRVSKGVAYHGMALNVAVDGAWFSAIQPCGLPVLVVNLVSRGVSLPLPVIARHWYNALCRLIS